MLFSLIIPIYNSEKYLGCCLDSVLNQDFEGEYEAILIDDGSTDRSADICRDYCSRNKNFRLLSKENGGSASARNAGIRAARGEYLLFLDSDDFICKSYFSIIEKLLVSKPDIAFFNLFDCAEDGSEVRKCSCIPLPLKESGSEYLNRLFAAGMMPFSYMCTHVFKRSFIVENGIFLDETLSVSEDFDFNMRAYPLASSIAGSDEAIYYYRTNPHSLSRVLSGKKVMDNLKTKAKYYRIFPVPVLADFFISQILLLPRMEKGPEADAAIGFIDENRDIISASEHRNYRIVAILFKIFGYRRGASIYCSLQKMLKG